MPMMSTTPSIPPSARSGVVEHALHVGAVVRVAGERCRVDLTGDVGGEVGVLVDARQSRADRCQRVRRLATDALAGAEHHEAPAVEAQEPRIVGDRGVVGAGHEWTPRGGDQGRRYPGSRRRRSGCPGCRGLT